MTTTTESMFKLGAVGFVLMAALGGNDMAGMDVGPFNVPPFFVVFSAAFATWAMTVVMRGGARVHAYVAARRNPWRRVVVPTGSLVAMVSVWLCVFTAGILATAPQENSMQLLQSLRWLLHIS